MTTPPFSVKGDRYDQSTFYGRYLRMLDIVDPRTLLASKAKVFEADAKVKAWAAASPVERAKFSDAELWEARKLRDSALHPDTGEFLYRPVRLAGYVPYNSPVCVAMVLAQSTPAIVFWHWVNQTQNALVNYYNANRTTPMSTATVAGSYATAVGSAVACAFGLSAAMKRALTPEKAAKALKWVALPACMAAGMANCYFMRRPELASGIDVYDPATGAVLGKSREAARKAVTETVLSRGVLPFPTVGLPPLVLALLRPKTPAATLAVSTAATFVFFGFGLPATVALFPTGGVMTVGDIGGAPREVRYNRGM